MAWSLEVAARRLERLPARRRGQLRALLLLGGAFLWLLGGAAVLGIAAVAARDLGAQVADEPSFWTLLLLPLPFWLLGAWLRALAAQLDPPGA